MGCQGERVRECCEVSGMLGTGVWRDRQEAPGQEIQVRAEERGQEQQTQYHSRMLDLEVFTVLVGLISSFYRRGNSLDNEEACLRGGAEFSSS